MTPKPPNQPETTDAAAQPAETSPFSTAALSTTPATTSIDDTPKPEAAQADEASRLDAGHPSLADAAIAAHDAYLHHPKD
jgi:hypothetical protein